MRRKAKAVFAALAASGSPLAGLGTADFAEAGPFFRMGRTPVAVDILTEIPGVDFDTAWQRRVAGVIDAASGVTADLISADDLIAARLAGGRPQDIADVAAIRTAAATPAARRRKKSSDPAAADKSSRSPGRRRRRTGAKPQPGS